MDSNSVEVSSSELGSARKRKVFLQRKYIEKMAMSDTRENTNLNQETNATSVQTEAVNDVGNCKEFTDSDNRFADEHENAIDQLESDSDSDLTDVSQESISENEESPKDDKTFVVEQIDCNTIDCDKPSVNDEMSSNDLPLVNERENRIIDETISDNRIDENNQMLIDGFSSTGVPEEISNDQDTSDIDDVNKISERHQTLTNSVIYYDSDTSNEDENHFIECETHIESDSSYANLNNAIPENQVSDSSSDVSVEICYKLPKIPTSVAKSRNYLYNSANTSPLIAADELDRCFPDRKITLFVGTWNMAQGKYFHESIDPFLLPDKTKYLPDIFVIGSQESNPDRSFWDIRIQETIGMSHVILHSVGFGVLYLTVLARRELIWYFSIFESDQFATRPGTAFKTKGAVAVSFYFFGTSFLFINSHLTPHVDKVNVRIQDCKRILDSINLPRLLPSKYKKCKDITERFDRVFWLGDLNFRIDLPYLTVKEKMHHLNRKSQLTEFEDLLVHDQLYKYIKSGNVLQGFQEHPIRFIPTYKFDLFSDHIDSSVKKRTPAYTDRILFKSQPATSDEPPLICKFYDSASAVRTSDHRPVYAIFEVLIQPARFFIPSSAGTFNHNAFVEGLKRRATLSNTKNSHVCSLM